MLVHLVFQLSIVGLQVGQPLQAVSSVLEGGGERVTYGRQAIMRVGDVVQQGVQQQVVGLQPLGEALRSLSSSAVPPRHERHAITIVAVTTRRHHEHHDNYLEVRVGHALRGNQDAGTVSP